MNKIITSEHRSAATIQLRVFVTVCRYSNTPITRSTLSLLRKSLPATSEQSENGNVLRTNYLYLLIQEARKRSRNPMQQKELQHASDYVFHHWPRTVPEDQQVISELIDELLEAI